MSDDPQENTPPAATTAPQRPAYADPNEQVECARCLARFPWMDMHVVQAQRYCQTCGPDVAARLGAPLGGPHDWAPMEGLADA